MTKAINSWVIPLLRYGAGLLKWTKQEFEWMDRKTKKVVTMYKLLHPKSDLARLYVQRPKEGKRIISCESCIKGEENSLA